MDEERINGDQFGLETKLRFTYEKCFESEIRDLENNQLMNHSRLLTKEKDILDLYLNELFFCSLAPHCIPLVLMLFSFPH